MDIEAILEMYEDYTPSSMVPGPRNMYAQGQLVQPNVDGSRPGYSGEGGAALRLKNLEKDISKYTKEALDEGAKAVLEAGSKSLDMKQTIRDLIEEGVDTYAELPTALKTKVKNQIDKYGEVTDEASARLLGRDKKTKTDREKLPDRGAKVVKGSYTRDYTNGELRVLAEEGLYNPDSLLPDLDKEVLEQFEAQGFDSDGFKKGIPKKKTVTDRIVDIQFSDPKIKEEFIEDFKKRFKGTRMTAGKRGVDNKNLYTKYLSNLKPKTAELALAGLQASLSEQYGDEYRYKADKASLAKETKTSDAYLERISNDPQNLKVKARNIANLSTPEGKGLGILQHMYPKRMGDALNKLALDTTDLTTYGKAEFVLQNLDFEKQKLLEDPVKNKRRIDEIQAIENRIVKGKNVPEVTTTSKRVNQYEPKPKTEYNVKFRRPGQKGLYGYEKIDTNNFVSKLKGADTSRSVAGTADDVLSKIDFKNVNPQNAEQIIVKLADALKKGGLKVSKTQSKGIAKKLADSGFECILSRKSGGTINCNDPRAYAQSIKENMAKVQQGDNAAIAKVNKLGKGMNAFRKAAKFTGWGLLTELGIAAPLGAIDYAKGANKDEIISNATYGLFGKSEDEQLREKYSDYGLAKDFQKTYDKLLKQENALGDQTGYGPIINPQNVENTEKKLMQQAKQFDSVLPPSQGLKSEFDLDKFLNMMVTDQQREKLFADQKAQRSEEIGILKPSTGLESYDNFMEGGIASLNVNKK